MNLFKYMRDKRGQSMVEMAIALPVLILIFASMIDVGRVVFAQMTVTSAASTGARNYVATLDIDKATAAANTAASTIQNVETPIVAAVTFAGVTTVTVTVTAKVNILTPVISHIFPNPYTVTGVVIM